MPDPADRATLAAHAMPFDQAKRGPPMNKPLKFPPWVWVMIVLMLILNTAVLTGLVTGILPDLLRLAVSLLAMIGIVLATLRWRRDR